MSIARQVLLLVFLAVAGGLGWLVLEERAAAPSEGGPANSAPAGAAGAPEGLGRQRAVAVEVASAAQRTLQRSVEAVGTTRALQSVDIVPLAEGRVVERNITPGRDVDPGFVIARLDTGIEEATLAEAEATRSEKASALERSATLQRSNASTVSEATLDALAAELAVAEAGVQRARQRLEDRAILAPFAGVLGIGNVDLGAFVETSTVLTTLDDLSEVEVQFSLPETVYGQIRRGQTIEAESAAFPGRVFEGEVVAVDSRIDPVSRAFRVRARLPNEDRALPVGMFMRLDLALEDRTAVVVPEVALSIDGGDATVYVATGEVVQRRPVTIGLRRDGFVEVIEGVAAGEDVVTRGIQSLRDGATVTVLGTTPVPGAGPTEPVAPAATAAQPSDGSPT
ncbi:efflux RND transporter periplasmic adaptor subunit [Acuticoccus sp.]|uniref:efflux RND transporter periplasmic adaptor subunit n=1 Tax=Acuticoccus sp. TaxID=1904378 RepID=UPI003B527F5A